MASVWNYPIENKFTLSTKKTTIDKINNISRFVYDAEDKFISVTKPCISVIEWTEWTHGTGDIEFFLESIRTNEVFRVSGSTKSGVNFKHYKAKSDKRQLPLKITSTMFLETFSILGILGIRTFEEAIKFNYDDLQFNPSVFAGVNQFTKSEINSILENATIEKPHSIIHNSINDYYAALSEFEERNFSIKHLKNNTSDVVLIYSKHTKEDLLNALRKSTEIKYDLDGMITLDSIRFKQVSLKLSKEGARLGRITSVVKNLTNMNSEWNIDVLNNCTSFSKSVNRITNKINKLKDIVYTKTNSKKLIALHVKETEIKETSNSYSNLVKCNDISLECLIRLVPIIKAQGANEHISNILDVMRRGSTTLPVVVSYSSGECEVLNEPIQIKQNKTEPVIITLHPSGETHYVISVYYLIDNQDDPVYVKIQMTNAGGEIISWKVEGNTTTTHSKIMDSLK